MQESVVRPPHGYFRAKGTCALDQVDGGRVCLNGHFTSHKSNVYTCMWVSDTTSAQRWLSGWVVRPQDKDGTHALVIGSLQIRVC